MRRELAMLGLLAVLASCAPRKIPGTDLDDTSDTRAVLDVMQRYRSAVEHRDTEALVRMADRDFRDDGGSADPEDDLSYDDLKRKLPARMSRVADLRLDLTVKRIEFDEDAKVARVTYSYQLSFKLPEYSTRTKSENDIKQMLLKRDGSDGWKIASGI